jgi:hypothetical protein
MFYPIVLYSIPFYSTFSEIPDSTVSQIPDRYVG